VAGVINFTPVFFKAKMVNLRSIEHSANSKRVSIGNRSFNCSIVFWLGRKAALGRTGNEFYSEIISEKANNIPTFCP
jgi:hypothetical protein